jgi:peptidyl-dipeptidase Dcp
MEATEITVAQISNPLLRRWSGPFGGVPTFAGIEVSHFQPAFEEAMRLYMDELDRIGNDPSKPNFENTIARLERTGELFSEVKAIYNIWSSNLSTPEFQKVELELEPRLAAFNDSIYQHESLFKRIEHVFNDTDKATLTAEQQRLVWVHYTEFVRSGAKLDHAQKEELSAINQRLAELFTRFSQNILAEEQQFLLVEKEVSMKGLPQAIREAARAEAESRGHHGKWIILNTRSSVDPFLTYAEDRSLRREVWQMFVNRGDNGNEHDNNAIIKEILERRSTRAKLLGYETHAHWALENTMAKTPHKAKALLEEVWPYATQRVQEEVKDMQSLADNLGHNIKIEPWDYRFYLEKVRKERYDLDDSELTPYLQLDRLRESMFFVAEKLFDLKFTPVKVPVYHPDVLVWAVTYTSGQEVGLWYFDPFARSGKRSGAWMTDYREQHNMGPKAGPLVSNNSNFVKGKPGEPILISWDDATTLYHEFGHALHGLLSNVTYPSLSGTNVVRDYVEFPSQLLEHWLMTPEVLNKFATHYKTGEPMPEALIEKLRRTATFNQGFATMEYLASAIIDINLHLATSQPIDPKVFEKQTLDDYKMPSELVMRHRTPQFMHIFSDDGYAAGYYSYLWADVITADAFDAFLESGGAYDRDVATRLLKHVLSAGNMYDPAEAYRRFRGKDPGIKALLKKRGLID